MIHKFGNFINENSKQPMFNKGDSNGYIVAIYEDGEIGAGYGFYIVNTKDFDKSKEDERKYLEAIQNAISKGNGAEFGGADCNVYLHNILEGDEPTNIELIVPPCKIDYAIYIFII